MSDAQKFRLSHVLVTVALAVSLGMSTWVLYTTAQNHEDIATLKEKVNANKEADSVFRGELKALLTEVKDDIKSLERQGRQ